MGTKRDHEEAYSPWKLDPEEALAQIKHFLRVAVSHLMHLGFSTERLSTLGNSQDPYIRWVAIDDVPVYRTVVMPDVDDDGEEVMAAYGTWLDTAEDFLKGVEGPTEDSDTPADADAPTDPDITMN